MMLGLQYVQFVCLIIAKPPVFVTSPALTPTPSLTTPYSLEALPKVRHYLLNPVYWMERGFANPVFTIWTPAEFQVDSGGECTPSVIRVANEKVMIPVVIGQSAGHFLGYVRMTILHGDDARHENSVSVV